ncbi:MAG: hypothetical protein WKF97_23795 [Chitinophagaceae bacterium]
MNAKMGSFAGPAGIAVVNKFLFTKRVEFVDKVMMHHPVFKIGRKNFPLYRFVYNKGNASLGLVTTIGYFFL